MKESLRKLIANGLIVATVLFIIYLIFATIGYVVHVLFRSLFLPVILFGGQNILNFFAFAIVIAIIVSTIHWAVINRK